MRKKKQDTSKHLNMLAPEMLYLSGITWSDILEQRLAGNLSSRDVALRVLSALNVLVENKEAKSLTEVARRVGVVYQKFNDIKNGKSSFDYDLLTKINDAFPNAFSPNKPDNDKSDVFLQVVDRKSVSVHGSVQKEMFPNAGWISQAFLMDIQMILNSGITPFKKMSDIAKHLNLDTKVFVDACSGRKDLTIEVINKIEDLLGIDYDISSLATVKPSVSTKFNDIIHEDSVTYDHRYKYPKEKQVYIGYRIAEIIVRYHGVLENYEVMAQNIGIEPNQLRLIILGYIPITDSMLRSILLVYPQIDPVWLSTGKGQVLVNENLQEVNKVVFENHRLAIEAWKEKEIILEQLKSIATKLDSIIPKTESKD